MQSGDAADCLTASQVAAVRGDLRGPEEPRTGKPIYPGFERGSETMFPSRRRGPEPFPVATTFMRGLVFKDPKWDFK